MKLAEIIEEIISKTKFFRSLQAGHAILEETREFLTPVCFSSELLQTERKAAGWELNEITGCSLDVPQEAVNISCAVLAETSAKPVAQIRFNLSGIDYTYRAVAAKLFFGTEISPVSASWGQIDTVYVQYRKACCRQSDQASLITWYDAASGTSYSLSAEGKVDKADIVYAARAAFASEPVYSHRAVQFS